MIRKSYRQSSVHEYINITKQLPSTNPLRSPTPDIHSRRERIAKTPSPHINRDRLTLQNITNSMTKNSQEHQIESKDAKIALLLKEIENLKRGSKISNTQIFTDPKQGDLFEKLKSQVKIKEDENQDLRRRMEASLQESNAQTDNKIREILLKFYEEINHLKAENKLLNETLHKENNEGKKSLGSSFVEARFIDNNIILPLEKPTISQERYKKAKVQETQGGVISPYHDSQPNSKPMNPTNIQGGTINPYNDPHLQSKPMNQSGTISTYYEPQSKLINPNNIQAGTVSPYHDSYSQSKPMNPNNIQGGNISSYNDPQIQSKPINPNNIQGGTIGTYYDPHLQSKQMNPNNIQGGTYDQINPYHNSQSKPMNPNDTVNEDKLKSIIAEKDNKMRALADELVRLNEALKDKNQEIDGLYDRLRGNYGKNQDLDEAIKMKQHLQEKLQELEELKNKIPNEDHEKLKSIANKTPALIGEITELNDLIARLRNEKYTNEEKITVLAQEIDRLNELLKFTSQEPNTTHKDEKVALLAIEIDRLTNLILTQNTELQRLRSIEFQHDKLKKEHELLIEKYSNKNKSLDTKLKELEQLKEKCLLIDKAFTAEKEGLHEKVNALEKKAHSLISENQDLSKLHRKSISEKETMEQENLRINALKQDLAHELKRLTDTLKSKIHENEQKTQELEVLKTRLFETETHKSVILGSHDTERRKSQSIILENDRKNLQIDSLNQEIASLRNRLLEQETKGFSQEKDHEKLKKSHFDLNHRISTLQGQLDYQVAKDKDKAQGYESELRQKEEDLRELRQKLKGIEQEKSLELAKVRGSISESQYKQMGILAEKENLQMECENLRKERGDYQNKCNELKKALFQATGEVDRFKEQNEEYLLKIVLLSAINEGLNHEVYDLRLENTELLNKFQRVVSEKSIEEIKLKETLNENHKHKEREKRKSVQIIQEKDALNKTLDLISKDKEDLHKKLYENEVKNIDAQSNLRAFSIRYEEALMKVLFIFEFFLILYNFKKIFQFLRLL